mgnify:CR=1 FL=1
MSSGPPGGKGGPGGKSIALMKQRLGTIFFLSQGEFGSHLCLLPSNPNIPLFRF